MKLDLGFKSIDEIEEEKLDNSTSAFTLFKEMVEFYFSSGFRIFETLIDPVRGEFKKFKY